jgi:YHS domain-containing protein
MKYIAKPIRIYALLLLGTVAFLAGCQGLPQSRYDGKDYLVFVEPGDLMLQGHDVVALFNESRIKPGTPEYQTRYHDATYYFSSAENKAQFDGDPSKYEPAYGGHCAVAVALGHLSPAYIDTWKIIDGRLYVQHNQKALDLWNEDQQGNLVKSKKNWPVLLADYGKKDP